MVEILNPDIHQVWRVCRCEFVESLLSEMMAWLYLFLHHAKGKKHGGQPKIQSREVQGKEIFRNLLASMSTREFLLTVQGMLEI